MRSDLLNYYERELAYVRQLGAEFASKYPKVASRLLLEPNRCEDPHVERLIEAFSFLAARLHLKLDDEFPELTQALLGILFPHYIRPLPSMTVAEFSLDSERSGLTTRTVLPRGSALFSRATGGVRLQFRTGFDLELWPIRLAAAQWVTPERLAQPIRSTDAPGALRIELACGHGASFSTLPINSLRFFLNAEASIVYPLYEMLAGRCLRIIARDLNPRSHKAPVVLPASCLQPCGFSQEESLIPYPRRSFDGYRLLQEYFAFPEKFLFLELKGLEVLREAGFGENVELVFLCGDCERPDWLPMLQLGVSERTLRLGCCTLVNLFPHTADPVTLDGTRFEYPVVPDARRPDSYEVFSIESVVGTNPITSEVFNFDPFYSVRHSPTGRQGELFWHATRRDSSVRMDDNTDLWLSTVDLAGQPRRPDIDTLTVRCLCTNRELPSRMPFGEDTGDFELDVASTVTRVIALRKPTPTIRPSLGGAVLWRLLSQLSLNYLSLIEEGRDALQEILRLYTPPAGFGERQVEGLSTLTSRRHFARVMGDYGISFVRGMKVQVELDEECFVGASAYLFSSVLDRFLGLYVNMNGFSQLEVWSRQRKEILKQWPARSGYGILL
ncbi:type VI secretion system baseplate subunit TssF [Paludibaculum fermentans]|uniref:type VI secretion system baseplate subunit TssF n=1 Tax=Paludibaculum fermentans TaxID=1473598 RepID=UPI003EBA0510